MNQKKPIMARTKKFKKLSEAEKENAYIKANRKGLREAEIENQTGFATNHKIHKSQKTYNRKPKHKNFFSPSFA